MGMQITDFLEKRVKVGLKLRLLGFDPIETFVGLSASVGGHEWENETEGKSNESTNINNIYKIQK